MPLLSIAGAHQSAGAVTVGNREDPCAQVDGQLRRQGADHADQELHRGQVAVAGRTQTGRVRSP